jgi:uncharacterized protein YuzE
MMDKSDGVKKERRKLQEKNFVDITIRVNKSGKMMMVEIEHAAEIRNTFQILSGNH